MRIGSRRRLAANGNKIATGIATGITVTTQTQGIARGWNRRLWKLFVSGLAVIVAVMVFFAGVVVRVGIVSLGGLGGPRGFCGPLSFVIFVAGVVGSLSPLVA